MPTNTCQLRGSQRWHREGAARRLWRERRGPDGSCHRRTCVRRETPTACHGGDADTSCPLTRACTCLTPGAVAPAGTVFSCCAKQGSEMDLSAEPGLPHTKQRTSRDGHLAPVRDQAQRRPRPHSPVPKHTLTSGTGRHMQNGPRHTSPRVPQRTATRTQQAGSGRSLRPRRTSTSPHAGTSQRLAPRPGPPGRYTPRGHVGPRRDAAGPSVSPKRNVHFLSSRTCKGDP